MNINRVKSRNIKASKLIIILMAVLCVIAFMPLHVSAAEKGSGFTVKSSTPALSVAKSVKVRKVSTNNIRKGKEYRCPKIVFDQKSEFQKKAENTYQIQYRYKIGDGSWSAPVTLDGETGYVYPSALEKVKYKRYTLTVQARWADEDDFGEWETASEQKAFGWKKIDFGTEAVKQARKYLGAKYHGGGTSKSRIDCSGLVLKAWQPFGVNLYHKSDTQVYGKWRYCGIERGLKSRKVRYKVIANKKNKAYKSISKAKPGDVLYWKSNRRGGWSHVAIYTGCVDGKHYMIDSETAYTRHNSKPGVTEHEIGDYGKYSRGSHRVNGVGKNQLDRIVRYY